MTRLESDDCSYMGSHPVRAHEVLRHCVPMFEDRGPVLELGCGPGEFLHHDRRGRVTEHHHDPEWAYELAHVVKVPAAGDNRDPAGGPPGPRQAGMGAVPSNETYVVARG